MDNTKKNPDKSTSALDIVKLFKLCLKSWKVFVASILCCCLLGAAYMLVRKQTYEVDAQLMLPPESGSNNFLNLADIAGFSLGDMFGGSTTENEIAVMKSHSVFLQTAKDLGLNTTYYERVGFMKWLPAYEKSQLRLVVDPAMCDTIGPPILFKLKLRDNGNFDISAVAKKKKVLNAENVTLPATLETPYGPFTFTKTEYFGSPKIEKFKILFMSYSAAAETYAELVDVFAPNKKTDFVSLAFKTTSPEFGEKLLNTIIDSYNNLGNSQIADKNNRTLNFVNNRIASLTKELEVEEGNMETFMKTHKLTNVEYDAAAILEKSSKLDNMLLMAQMECEILGITREFVANPANKYSLIPALSTSTDAASSSAAIEIDSYNKLILERMRLATSASGNNTALKVLDAQIDASRANIVSSVERAYDSAQLKYKELKSENARTQSRIGSIPSLEKEYGTLQRNLILKEQLYLFLLKQREEASMNLEKTTKNLITIDPPYTLSKQPGLTNKMILALALLLGLMLPLSWIMIFRMKNAPVRAMGDLHTLADPTIIGHLRHSAAENPIEAMDTPFGEDVRLLRSNLRFVLDEFGGKAILVASTQEGEGKTFSAVALADALALTGRKTLLVDANLRSPMASSILGLSSAPGLADAAEGEPVADCIVKAGAGNGNLWVLPAGKHTSHPADLVSSEAVADMIQSLKQQFDYLVIDTPALKEYSDALAFAEPSDITVYLCRIGVTTTADIESVNDLYDQGRLKRIAILANDVRQE